MVREVENVMLAERDQGVDHALAIPAMNSCVSSPMPAPGLFVAFGGPTPAVRERGPFCTTPICTLTSDRLVIRSKRLRNCRSRPRMAHSALSAARTFGPSVARPVDRQLEQTSSRSLAADTAGGNRLSFVFGALRLDELSAFAVCGPTR